MLTMCLPQTQWLYIYIAIHISSCVRVPTEGGRYIVEEGVFLLNSTSRGINP